MYVDLEIMFVHYKVDMEGDIQLSYLVSEY